jgi:hypothetical protein
MQRAIGCSHGSLWWFFSVPTGSYLSFLVQRLVSVDCDGNGTRLDVLILQCTIAGVALTS